MLDPSLFVGFYVVPLWLKFVPESPKELTLDSVIKDVPCAVTKNLHISITEEGGVSSALAVVNSSSITFTIGTESSCSSVEVYVMGCR